MTDIITAARAALEHDRDTLAALVARVEAATGPDANLDGDVVAFMQQHENPWVHTGGGWLTAWGMGVLAAEVTRSIDAALTLVPEGTDRWAVWRGMRGSCASVEHDKPHMWSAHAGRAATPALALVAAALRARLAQMESEK